MKVSDAITQFKTIIHDISNEYGAWHIIMRLNSAAQQVAAYLADIAHPLMLHEGTFKEGDTLPHNFLRTAGIYPLQITGRKVSLLVDEDELAVRYFTTVDQIESDQDDMPFDSDFLNDYVIRLAVVFALNRNEFDVTQDKALLDELKTAVEQAV